MSNFKDTIQELFKTEVSNSEFQITHCQWENIHENFGKVTVEETIYFGLLTKSSKATVPIFAAHIQSSFYTGLI